MKKTTFSFSVALLLLAKLSAQEAGNQIYSNPTQWQPAPVVQQVVNIHPSTNQYLVEANVLFHGEADRYIAVFGVEQESASAEAANEEMNRRVAAFRQDLQGMGIPERDIFTDLITQTRVYDYKMTGDDVAEEKVTGFQLKKNVHITYQQSALLEKMMLAAARQDIFDIVKVDYVLDNMDSIYAQMQAAALAVIEQKKRAYMMIEEKKFAGNPFIVKFEKGALQPVASYRQYTAHETNSIAMQSGLRSKANLVKISARRMSTFYFDPLPEEQFDRVINKYGVEPTVQMTLKLQVRYDVL